MGMNNLNGFSRDQVSTCVGISYIVQDNALIHFSMILLKRLKFEIPSLKIKLEKEPVHAWDNACLIHRYSSVISRYVL